MNKLKAFASDWETAMAKMPGWFQTLFGADSFWDFILRNSLQGLGVALVGWLVAYWLERRHLHQLGVREAELTHISLSTAKQAEADHVEGEMLIGSTVIAHDYFRTLFIQIRKLIGGNIGAYDRLVTRGRKEALVRLQEEAACRGIDRIINVRFASSPVAGRFLSAVELVAYGTGVRSKVGAKPNRQ